MSSKFAFRFAGGLNKKEGVDIPSSNHQLGVGGGGGGDNSLKWLAFPKFELIEGVRVRVGGQLKI